MRFTTYADVLTPEHPQWQTLHAGGNPTGHLLADVLAETGGRYTVTVSVPQRSRIDVRRFAVEGSDPALVDELASMTSVSIPLDHLRDCDPQTTRVVYGWRVDYVDDGTSETGNLV